MTPKRQLLTMGVIAVMVITMIASGTVLVGAEAESDDPPDLPASYYGTIMIDGEPAEPGTVIEAEIDGDIRGSITVEEPGVFGGPSVADEKLTVQGETEADEGAEIRFFVDGTDFERTEVEFTDPDSIQWEAGSLEQVDLETTSDGSQFEVTIENITSEVVVGENVSGDLSIANDGDQLGETEVTVTFAGNGIFEETVSLEPSETVTREFVTNTTDADLGEREVVADAGNSTARETVQVQNELAVYANEDGIIDTDGLRDAVEDWRNGDIDTELLRDVVDAWRTGHEVP